MTDATPSPFRALSPLRALRRAILALVAAAALVLLPASWANAHDELVATEPGIDSTVDELPESLTLRYSGELVAEDGTAQIVVTGPDGSELQDGAAVIDGAIVTQDLVADADLQGTVTVQWRVVSGDGHPVSGTYVFGVGEAPSETSVPAGGDEAGAEAASTLVWVAVGIVGVGMIVTLLVVFIARAWRPSAGSRSDSER